MRTVSKWHLSNKEWRRQERHKIRLTIRQHSESLVNNEFMPLKDGRSYYPKRHFHEWWEKL